MRKSATLNQNIVLILGGVACAIFVDAVMRLSPKYAAVTFLGVVLLVAALFFKDHLRQFFLYLLVLNVPLVGFEKTFFFVDLTAEGLPPVSNPGVGFGGADILLILLYTLWLGEIFVTRKSSAPKLSKVDLWVLAFIGINVLSMTNAPRPNLALFEITRLIKMFLLYFYMSRNVRRDDVKYLVICLAIGVVGESLLGIVQYSTGKLLGLGSGKGTIAEGYEEYIGPAFEGYRRAEGTSTAPHGLAAWFGMLLPIFFSFFLAPDVHPAARGASGIVFLMGAVTSLLTFARGGIYGLCIGAALVALGYLYLGHWKILKIGALLLLFLIPILIVLWKPFSMRFLEAPPELLKGRWEFAKDAMLVIKDSPIIGGGVNNYIYNLSRKNYSYLELVHTLYVLIAAEIGILGLIFFLGLIIANFIKGFRLFNVSDPLVRSLVIGLTGGMAAFTMDGFVNFTYIFNHNIYLFWLISGLFGALYRLNYPVEGLRKGPVLWSNKAYG